MLKYGIMLFTASLTMGILWHVYQVLTKQEHAGILWIIIPAYGLLITGGVQWISVINKRSRS
jgi:hypothetical protein